MRPLPFNPAAPEPAPPATKVGVLTFHRCINYGSYWQARCLVEGLRQRGLDAVLLDHHSPSVNRAEWKCALRPHLPAKTPRHDFPLYAAKARKFFEAFEALPLSAPFSLDHPEDMPLVDVAVIGSDEVWNFRHPWYAGYPLFFGEGLKAKRVVSYAASFGNHQADDGLDAYWADRLERLSAIGVRDDNSRRLVSEALGREPATVLDPCLQFGEICRRPGEIANHALVYGHSFPDWFAQAARTWADARGVKLVSLGYRNAWCDEHWISAGPEDFARAMGGAKAVITNFFHGCVFALNNRRPFVCTTSEYRSTKVSALLASIGAEAHLADENRAKAGFDQLEHAVDPSIPARIEALRRQSQAYLDHALD